MEVKSEREVAQSCPTLSDPMDYSLPGSSIHGIFQARVLEWGAIAFSQNVSNGDINPASPRRGWVKPGALPQPVCGVPRPQQGALCPVTSLSYIWERNWNKIKGSMKPLERTSLQTSRKFFPFQGWGKKGKKESILRLKIYLKMVHITRKKKSR